MLLAERCAKGDAGPGWQHRGRAASAPDVRAEGVWRPRDQLGAHVGRGAHDGVILRAARPPQRGEAKVADQELVGLAEVKVWRLEVAVHDALRLEVEQREQRLGEPALESLLGQGHALRVLCPL